MTKIAQHNPSSTVRKQPLRAPAGPAACAPQKQFTITPHSIKHLELRGRVRRGSGQTREIGRNNIIGNSGFQSRPEPQRLTPGSNPGIIRWRKAMDYKLLFTVFLTTLLAEMGDKTQLAVISYTASSGRWLPVFLGGAAALILTTLLGSLVGAGLQRLIPARILHFAAAAAFVLIGVLMFVNNLRVQNT